MIALTVVILDSFAAVVVAQGPVVRLPTPPPTLLSDALAKNNLAAIDGIGEKVGGSDMRSDSLSPSETMVRYVL